MTLSDQAFLYFSRCGILAEPSRRSIFITLEILTDMMLKHDVVRVVRPSHA